MTTAGEIPQQAVVRFVGGDDDGVDSVAAQVFANGSDKVDGSVQFQVGDSVESDGDRHVSFQAHGVELGQVLSLDFPACEVGQAYDGGTNADLFTNIGVEGSDSTGEGRSQLGLVQSDDGLFQCSLGGGDIGLNGGDAFRTCARLQQFELSLGLADFRLGGSDIGGILCLQGVQLCLCLAYSGSGSGDVGIAGATFKVIKSGLSCGQVVGCLFKINRFWAAANVGVTTDTVVGSLGLATFRFSIGDFGLGGDKLVTGGTFQ